MRWIQRVGKAAARVFGVLFMLSTGASLLGIPADVATWWKVVLIVLSGLPGYGSLSPMAWNVILFALAILLVFYPFVWRTVGRVHWAALFHPVADPAPRIPSTATHSSPSVVLEAGTEPGWAQLHVTNNGPADTFSVLVERIHGTGQDETPYHAPWRGKNEGTLHLVTGDRGTVNLAYIVPTREVFAARGGDPHGDDAIFELLRLNVRLVRSFSVEASAGFFTRNIPWGTMLRFHLKVLSSGSPMEYMVELLVSVDATPPRS